MQSDGGRAVWQGEHWQVTQRAHPCHARGQIIMHVLTPPNKPTHPGPFEHLHPWSCFSYPTLSQPTDNALTHCPPTRHHLGLQLGAFIGVGQASLWGSTCGAKGVGASLLAWGGVNHHVLPDHNTTRVAAGHDWAPACNAFAQGGCRRPDGLRAPVESLHLRLLCLPCSAPPCAPCCSR